MGALVVQWIERLTPNESIEVRFLARAHKNAQHIRRGG